MHLVLTKFHHTVPSSFKKEKQAKENMCIGCENFTVYPVYLLLRFTIHFLRKQAVYGRLFLFCAM